jgi:hypothetical protein
MLQLEFGTAMIHLTIASVYASHILEKIDHIE